MFGKWTYFLLMMASISVPFVYSFDKRINFIKNIKAFLISNLITFIVFVTWDIYFTGIGIWSFNPDYHLNLLFFKLPLEELMFFVFIPFCCIFVYENINYFFPAKSEKIDSKYLVYLGSAMILISAVFIQPLYPKYTFIVLGIILNLLHFLKIKNLFNIFLGYAFCLIPFFIVNGVLTSIPVVIYNNAENFGIRLWTIPAEDVFYGMAMVFLNILGYEKLKK